MRPVSWGTRSEKRDTRFANVKRLATQARLWKMAPDEMDSRYESLLRRCSATDRRFRVTTVSDVLAGLTDTLCDTVNQRVPIQLPQFVPCDLADGAPEDTLEALENDMIVENNSQADNGFFNLSGRNPSLITLVGLSPSHTSISPPKKPRQHFGDEKTRKYPRQSSVKKREQNPRRARRTPAAFYPRMSWKRAHEVVQRRQRKKSPYRPLETNPGWTPLQKAIIRSGILETPATMETVYPDSPTNDNNKGINTNSQDNTKALGHQDKFQKTPSEDQKPNISHLCGTGEVDRNDGATWNDHTPDPIKPSTPEVVVRQRAPITPCSISVFSDSSRGSRAPDRDEVSPAIEGISSPPRRTSTPICSAMELCLNAEPFVPRLINFNDSKLSEADFGWQCANSPAPFRYSQEAAKADLGRQCDNAPCRYTVPIQEAAKNNTAQIPDDHHDSCLTENNQSNTCGILDEPKYEKTTAGNPTVQYAIPVIENGIVKGSVCNGNKASDVISILDWIPPKQNRDRRQQTGITEPQDSRQQQFIPTQDPRRVIVPGFPVAETQQGQQTRGGPVPVDTRHVMAHGATQPQGITQGIMFVHTAPQEALPMPHPQVQQHHMGNASNVAMTSGPTTFNGHRPNNQNVHVLNGNTMHQRQFQQNIQHGGRIPRVPDAAPVNNNWQQPNQPQQMHFGEHRPLGASGAQQTHFPINNQAWGNPQMQPNIQQIHMPQPRQHQQQHQGQFNHLQQQQPERHRHEVVYRQQNLHNNAAAGCPLNNIGNHQHAGFNNNNFGQQQQPQQQVQQAQLQQQIQQVQPPCQQVPSYHGPPMNHQHAQHNATGQGAPLVGARFPLGPAQWPAGGVRFN